MYHRIGRAMPLRVVLVALLLLGPPASGDANAPNRTARSLRSCDASSPLAPPPPPDGENDRRRGLLPWSRERRLVAIRPGGESREYYETGEYYAPLCPDGIHVDVRKLYRCNGGSCWNECIQQCTFECTWNPPTPRPTSVPTQEPTFPRIEIEFVETDYPLLIELKNLSDMYRLNAKLRAAIVDYLYGKLRVDMQGVDPPVGLELLELDYVGRLPGLPHGLPLSAKVRGPSDLVDNALSYLWKLVKDSEEEIAENLKDLDDAGGAAFGDVRVIAGTYDLGDVVQGEWTSPPTISPTAEPEPKPEPELEPEKVMAADILEVEEMTTDVPWWVWLIVALAILLSCCTCCVCFGVYRSRRKSHEKQIDIKQQINASLQNRRRLPRRLSSLDETKGTKRTRRPPQSKQSVRSKRSARTNRSRKVHAPPASRPPASPPVIAIPRREASSNTEATRVAEPWPAGADAFDAQTALSALPEGCEPPEERAVVPFDPSPRARDPTFYADRNLHARDPTFYSDCGSAPAQVEPEGDVADDSLMREVRSKQEESRREREAKSAQAGWRDDPEIGSRDLPDPREERYRDNQAYYHQDRHFLEPDEFQVDEEGYGGHQASYHSERVLSEPEGFLSDDLKSVKKKKKSKKKSRKARDSSSRSKTTAVKRTRPPFEWEKTDSLFELKMDSSVLTEHVPPPESEHRQQVRASRSMYAEA